MSGENSKQKLLKKINKIKSVKEILDFDGDGKVEKKELDECIADDDCMNDVKKISPMVYYLMRNEKLKVEKLKIPKKGSQIKIARRSLKEYAKDKNLFKVRLD